MYRRNRLTVDPKPKAARRKPRTFKVENNTRWNTRDLKAIIARVARKFNKPAAAGSYQNDVTRRPEKYIIGYSTKGHRGSFPDSLTEIKKNSSGTSYRAKKPNVVARLYVPKAAAVQPVQFAIAVYETIEFGSYRGPSDDFRRRIELAQEYAWAEVLGIAPKPPKAKPTAAERRDKRRQSVLAAIKRWQTKQKRAATALRKLRTKLRRIDKAAGKADES